MKTYIQLCLWALAVLWKFKTITKVDRLRLWRKTVNLFLCFTPFTDKERPKSQLEKAMLCGLLSAVYDYETDWVPIQGPHSLCRELLEEFVADPSTRHMAWDLFEKDRHKRLSKHGLERGSIALAFYKAVIGSKWLEQYSAEEIETYGRRLQIVDDVLDYEEDDRLGHMNCLLTPEHEQYLDEVREFMQSEFCKRLEQSSSLYYRICCRLFYVGVEETPTTWRLITSCRPHTGLFAFVLSIVGFKILHLPLLPALPIAFAFCGITLSIMIFNDLMDKNRDMKKGKTFASRYPWHIFRAWKWTSGTTAITLILTAMLWWQLALFGLTIWFLGLGYSLNKLPYPLNNLLVALCSGSPCLVGMIRAQHWDPRVLLLFFIVFTTILAMETVKDMQDRVADIGDKDTLATRMTWPAVATHAILLCYLPVVGVLLYPNGLARPLGYVFGIVVFFLGLSFTRTKALQKAERAGDLFLALLLLVLLCTH